MMRHFARKVTSMSLSVNLMNAAPPASGSWTAEHRLGAPLWEASHNPYVEQIVQAARMGDDVAFGKLIELYRAAAERLAQQILRTEEAAADAVQEAMIKAHRAMARFQDGNFRSWFLRIVTNTCYDHLRRQKRRLAVSLDELTEEAGIDYPVAAGGAGSDPEDAAIQNDQMRLLLGAIEALPDYHRNVVVLVDVQGYDYNEASALLGLPLGTVKSRLSRARAALRDELVRTGIVIIPPC
jgi:RNA polymerase sigma-70 factor (ECF subfamily)